MRGSAGILQPLSVFSTFQPKGLRISVSVIATALLLQTSFASAAEDESSYTRQLEDNQAAIASIEQAVRDNRKDRQRLQKSLQALQADKSDRDTRIRELAEQTREYEAKLARFEARNQRLQKSLQADKTVVSSMMRARLREQQYAGIKLLLSGRDPLRTARHSTYLTYLQNARVNHIESVVQRIDAAESAHQEALKSRNWLEYLSDKALKQRQNIHQQAKKTSASVADLQQSEINITNRKEDLLAERREVEALLEELQQTRSRGSGYFEAGKGAHQWPSQTAGEIRLFARFGDARAGGKLNWKGIHIESPSGSTVHAIADGEVVYADNLAALGLVVVLQHGDSYLSLYGGNGKIEVNPGEWVETGSTIATVGKNTGPIPAGTYLEIRKNAVPLDPEKWLDAIKRVKVASK